MKLKPWVAAIGLTMLFASAASFAHSKAELNAGAAKALKHFYALNPANKTLADKAAGVLIFSRVTKGGAGVAGEFGEGSGGPGRSDRFSEPISGRSCSVD